jgi:CRISPR-associated exonuclease Cas4
MYSEDELLMISGIQHFCFCKKQWSLIHSEQQWKDNFYTVKGEIMHEKVDDPFIIESRKDYFISRSVPLVSYSLGFYGISDAVEFKLSDKGYFVEGKNNFYKVYPIEYKSGKPKKDNSDAVQLCVQAMCLEEMLNINIEEAYLYYGKTRHREKILLNENLRKEVVGLASEMHTIIEENIAVVEEYTKKCDNCSLYNICIPKAKTVYKSVNNYIKSVLKEIND